MFIIEKPFKTIIRREGKHLFFSLLFFSIMVLPVFAQIPSFEIYPSGDHPWPDIENTSVNKVSDSLVTIGAEVTDVSSIYSAGVIIKNSAGNQREQQLLYDDGNHQDGGAGDSVYGALILIDSYPLDTFTVDFFATDVFGNRADLPNAGSFITGGTLADYSYRKKITIQNDQIESDLTNFPLLVSIPSAIAGKMEDTTNWKDIRFTGGDGLTLLTYEKESMSASGGKYWVKVPNIYASPTGRQNQIFVYYGKAGDTDGSDPANVWDNNFKGVWHSNNITTTTISDSTSNGNTGTKKGIGEPVETNGKIGEAQQYDGLNDYINAGTNVGNFGTSSFTVNVWVKRSTVTNDYRTFISKDPGIPGWYIQFITTNKVRFGTRVSGNANYLDSTGIIADTIWHHIVVTRDVSGTKRIYINGAVDPSFSTHTVNVNSTANLFFGQIASQQYLNGLIDEVRISNTARPAAWIKFEYANVSQTDNELTWGGEQEL